LLGLIIRAILEPLIQGRVNHYVFAKGSN